MQQGRRPYGNVFGPADDQGERDMPTETTLITGASSGIGEELARLFARDRSNLVLVARSRDRLEALAAEVRSQHAVSVEVLVEDLAQGAAPQRIYDTLTAKGIVVDVLVNNAGFGARGAVSEVPLQRQIDMIHVNVTALTHLTRLFLPEMLRRNRGGILNVGSLAGFQPGPYMAVYYATKAYVVSLSEALAEELTGSAVKVTCLAPGATATRFKTAAGLEHALLFKLGTMDAKVVAAAGYRGFRRGRVLVIPGLHNKLTAFAVRFTPRPWVRKIAKRLQA
jgi:uncharacterized protein